MVVEDTTKSFVTFTFIFRTLLLSTATCMYQVHFVGRRRSNISLSVQRGCSQKQVHSALTIARLTRSPYPTKIVRVRCYTPPTGEGGGKGRGCAESR